jgi:hypothetical protein
MRRFLPALLASFLCLALLTTPVLFAQTEGVGLGASIGVTNGTPAFDRNPIGFNAKVWTSDRQAVSGMTSFFISGTNAASQSYWVLQGDYLFHNFNKLEVGEGFLALYLGAGGQITIFEDTRNQFALRAPLGVNYLLGSSPIDVFVEVSPTLRVTDPESLRFDGAIGFRYYFSSGSSDSSGNGSGSSQ